MAQPTLEAYTDSRIASLHDIVLSEVWLEDDVDFYIRAARQAMGPAIELGCGTGRVAIALARAGLEVTAVDIAPAMLDLLRAKLHLEPAAVQERVRIETADFVEMSLDQRFETAILACNTFGHLTDRASQTAALECIERHLNPGGQLLLNVAADFEVLTRPTRTAYRYCAAEDVWFCCDDRIAAADPATGLVDLQWVYEFLSPDGSCEKRVLPVTLRYTPAEEIEALLRAAGFSTVFRVAQPEDDACKHDTVMIAARK